MELQALLEGLDVRVVRRRRREKRLVDNNDVSLKGGFAPSRRPSHTPSASVGIRSLRERFSAALRAIFAEKPSLGRPVSRLDALAWLLSDSCRIRPLRETSIMVA
jgi:hypothetical protein